MLLVGGLVLGAKAVYHRLHHNSSSTQPASQENSSSGFFQLDRIIVWLNPDSNCQTIAYQVCLSRTALGAGGPLGAGIGDGRQKFLLPEADSDFIFSTVGEELGFLGSACFVLLYIYFVFRGINISASTSDPFGSLLALGISVMIGIQAFINISTVTSMLPATGLPLPFISYGGSSLCVCLTLVGILLNISRNPKGDPLKKSAGMTIAERQFYNRFARASKRRSQQSVRITSHGTISRPATAYRRMKEF
jgi:cell division protein FtsW